MKNIKGFNYNKTEYMYIRKYEDSKWNEGELTKDENITISAMSTSLHYGQQAFEGLKAYKNTKGEINLFRVKDNAKRFRKSCERLLMPAIPEEEFVDAVKKVVLANDHNHLVYGNPLSNTYYNLNACIGSFHNYAITVRC